METLAVKTATGADASIILGGSYFYSGTTTNLTNNSTFTGDTRDVGVAAGALHPFSYYNAYFFADKAGLATVEVSADGSTWRAIASAVLSVNVPLTLSVPVMARYYRHKLLNNGGSTQTAVLTADSFTRN